jgi:polyhydroxybutyrate depolymerase
MTRRSCRRAAALFLLCLAQLACKPRREAPPQPSQRFPKAGNYREEISYAGLTRAFALHLPTDYAKRVPLPVLVVFHGLGNDGRSFERLANIDPQADSHGFAVIYPNGTGRFGRRSLEWNAGACCGQAAEAKIDDVGFTLALLANLSHDLDLDEKRLYLAGHANGAMLAYRVAAEASNRVAAMVTVAGADMTESFAPSEPVALLHIHSVDDPRATFEGGYAKSLPYIGGHILHRPVAAGLARWRERDGCTGEGKVSDPRQVGDHSAEYVDYGPCASGYDVALWRLHGSGHPWPGAAPRPLDKIQGPSTTVLDAAAEVFRFVERFRKDQAPLLGSR